MSLTQYSDSGSRTIVRHDGKGRPLETRRPGSAWQARLQLAAYSTNAADEMTNHYDRYDFLDACTEEIDSGSLSSHLRGNPSYSTGRLTGIEQRRASPDDFRLRRIRPYCTEGHGGPGWTSDRLRPHLQLRGRRHRLALQGVRTRRERVHQGAGCPYRKKI